jgi:pimeloyl-ACP methyl ester carboxylesterase
MNMQAWGRAKCIERRRADAVLKEQRETMVLLHGSAGSSALWRALRATLSPLYYVIAPDLIGYGESASWPRDEPFMLEDEAERVDALLPCCEHGIHLVGYSYGGAVALQLACADPDRVRTLTLIEPVFFAALRYGGERAAYDRLAEVRTRFTAALDRGEPEIAMRDFIEFWTGTGSWDVLPRAVREAMLAMSRKIRLDWAASFAADPGPAPLATLARKTLLVRGDRSPEPMLKLVDALHRLMPGSTCVVVGGAGHLLPVTHGNQLEAALVSHLQADADRRLR